MSKHFWNSLSIAISVFFDENEVHYTIFSTACISDNNELINLLIEFTKIDPSAKNNFAIRYTSEKGHIAVVDRLLQEPKNRVDSSADINYAIRVASKNGHIAVVERLLQDRRVDPSAVNNFAIRYASHNGHIAIMDRLLQDGQVKSGFICRQQ